MGLHCVQKRGKGKVKSQNLVADEGHAHCLNLLSPMITTTVDRIHDDVIVCERIHGQMIERDDFKFFCLIGIMLPLSLLRTAQGHPMLVELKNGETYNGYYANFLWDRHNYHITLVLCHSTICPGFH